MSNKRKRDRLARTKQTTLIVLILFLSAAFAMYYYPRSTLAQPS